MSDKNDSRAHEDAIRELIKKKEEENSALKKLLTQLGKADQMSQPSGHKPKKK